MDSGRSKWGPKVQRAALSGEGHSEKAKETKQVNKRDAPVLKHQRAPDQSRTGGATMAAKEVIHLPLRAQLSRRLWFPARAPIDLVAKSPPNWTDFCCGARRQYFQAHGTRVSGSSWVPASNVSEGNFGAMTTDAYAELYLFNTNVDSLIRALQCVEALGICSKQTLKATEVRLNELRAGLNADL
jgi:hypothetical protein